MSRNYWRLIPLLFFASLVLLFWRGLSLDPQKLPSARLNQPLPSFSVPMLNKEQIFTSQSLQGKVVLLNVWASWCKACVDEAVFLMQLAREGVPIYGLSYKDKTKDANQWLEEWGNPYRAIGEDKKGKVGIDLGVYGAPETFLIDKHGLIRYRHVGILDESIWSSTLLPLYKALKEEP